MALIGYVGGGAWERVIAKDFTFWPNKMQFLRSFPYFSNIESGEGGLSPSIYLPH